MEVFQDTSRRSSEFVHKRMGKDNRRQMDFISHIRGIKIEFLNFQPMTGIKQTNVNVKDIIISN